MPARGEPRRADGLWKHTCFEAFISDANSGGYAEFNCAPSGDWAAYHFASYRSEPLPLVLAQVPISTEIVTGRLRLAAELDLGCLPGAYRRPGTRARGSRWASRTRALRRRTRISLLMST